MTKGQLDKKAKPRRAQRAEPEAPRRRRALSHVGGDVHGEASDPADRRLLESALDVSSDESEVMAHVHGFHVYPARLHPVTAGRLVEGLTQAGDRVLDPFCGSGTVLVEARRRGRRTMGVDTNPIAIELAWLKTGTPSAGQLGRLLTGGTKVVEHADERRRTKAGPTRRYGPTDRDLFDPHILLELDGLRSGIEALPEGPAQRALWLVLSSVLVKVSRRATDTKDRKVKPRLASGFAIRLFASKLEELARRLREYGALVPDGTPRCRLEVGDARRIDSVRPASVDLVLSSPPYPGVYDYADHHALRLRWLDLDVKRTARTEIGSRRQLSALTPDEALRLWRRDFGRSLEQMRNVLRPRGVAALVMGDSALGTSAVRADEVIARIAPKAGLTVRAQASQPRPWFYRETAAAFRGRGRFEWLFLLAPAAGRRG